MVQDKPDPVLEHAAALVVVSSAPVWGEPTISIEPEEQWEFQFEFVAVNITVNDEVLGLTGFDLLIDYNEAILNLYSVQQGPLPSSGGDDTFFFWTDAGQPSDAILIQGAVLGASVDGPGVLATIVFQGWVVAARSAAAKFHWSLPELSLISLFRIRKCTSP